MAYPILKALHIMAIVTWFAGLFYIVRLFIYDVEARSRPEPECAVLSTQLAIMQRRLWYGITWPSMVATIVFGGALLVMTGLWSAPWMHAKLAMVVLLIAYHLTCGRIYRQLRSGSVGWSSKGLRLWNELATLFLVGIVFLAVLKSAALSAWFLGILSVIAAVLCLAVWLYGRSRQGGERSGLTP